MPTAPAAGVRLHRGWFSFRAINNGITFRRRALGINGSVHQPVVFGQGVVQRIRPRAFQRGTVKNVRGYVRTPRPHINVESPGAQGASGGAEASIEGVVHNCSLAWRLSRRNCRRRICKKNTGATPFQGTTIDRDFRKYESFNAAYSNTPRRSYHDIRRLRHGAANFVAPQGHRGERDARGTQPRHHHDTWRLRLAAANNAA